MIFGVWYPIDNSLKSDVIYKSFLKILKVTTSRGHTQFDVVVVKQNQ